MDIIFSSLMIYYFAPGLELAVNQGCVTTECRSFASFAAGPERSAMNKQSEGGRNRTSSTLGSGVSTQSSC